MRFSRNSKILFAFVVCTALALPTPRVQAHCLDISPKSDPKNYTMALMTGAAGASGAFVALDSLHHIVRGQWNGLFADTTSSSLTASDQMEICELKPLSYWVEGCALGTTMAVGCIPRCIELLSDSKQTKYKFQLYALAKKVVSLEKDQFQESLELIKPLHKQIVSMALGRPKTPAPILLDVYFSFLRGVESNLLCSSEDWSDAEYALFWMMNEMPWEDRLFEYEIKNAIDKKESPDLWNLRFKRFQDQKFKREVIDNPTTVQLQSD